MSDSAPAILDPAGGQPLTLDAALDLLARGEIEMKGLLPYSSNYTFLVVVRRGEAQAAAVYKPCRGERPLWDFPEGTLANREVAAHAVSQALDWMIVPPTVLRDGPHGPGMAQVYVHNDPDEHYFTFGKRFSNQLKKIALFDALVNNADRKSGHCLLDGNGYVWAIDHGICFHEEPKLRTVIWEFAGQPIPAGLLRDVRAFRKRLSDHSDGVTKSLADLLSREEMAALRERAHQLVARSRFPIPSRYERHIPWPPV